MQFTDKEILDKLTHAEMRILRELSGGKTAREIGKALYLSPKTCRNHMANIRSKLKIFGFHSLLKFAIEHRHLFNGIDQMK